MADNHLSDLRFDALSLHESMQAGIRDAGFEFCTPIQASTLPIALQSKDVAFTEIALEAEPGRRAEMISRAGGSRTVPQIFINGMHVGDL